MSFLFPNWQRENWRDFSEEALIHSPDEAKESVAGDPQILLPGEFDSQWHLFHHGFGSDFKSHVFHHVSDDGISFSLVDKIRLSTNPCYIFRDKDAGQWILYYSALFFGENAAEAEKYNGFNNIIRAVTTKDFKTFSEPVDILTPSLAWEEEGSPKQLRNPCVVKCGEKDYRLYYSAGTVLLPHCKFEEPKYIGVAFSKNPMGPFEKRQEPVFFPDESVWYKNYGAGAIKVFQLNDTFLALYNSIYIQDGYERSAINAALSHDGIVWEDAPYNPIVVPKPGTWKNALVYQLDLVRYRDEIRLYYNARDDFKSGIERIGMSCIVDTTSALRKLW